MRDHRSGAVALRTRARRHDLTEKRPGDLTHLATAVADAARRRMRARRRAGAAAGVTHQCGVDRDVARRTESCFHQLQVQPDQRIRAGTRPWSRPAARRAAEERVEDVTEPAEPREPARQATGAGVRITSEVVDAPL